MWNIDSSEKCLIFISRIKFRMVQRFQEYNLLVPRVALTTFVAIKNLSYRRRLFWFVNIIYLMSAHGKLYVLYDKRLSVIKCMSLIAIISFLLFYFISHMIANRYFMTTINISEQM